MSEDKKYGPLSLEERERMTEEERYRFQQLADHAAALEKEINGMIADFERKHHLSCWISTEKHNQISIDIAIDRAEL